MPHEHDHHGHSHAPNYELLSSQRGIWAVKWSFVLLAITAVLQLVVVYYSRSVALLADTIHNFGDATTSVPLWIAFRLSSWKPTKRFTYGYGRVEDLAGIAVVATILFSAIVAGWQAIERLLHPQPMSALGAVVAASVLGFFGNEAVAQFRIKVGREISSAALIADGQHARIDGFTSLSVLLGAIGTWLGWPILDPLVGIGITIAIFGIVIDSMKIVVTRMLDGVEPDTVDRIRHAASHATGVREITEVRARWVGHRLHVEINLAVAPGLSVEEGHRIAKEARHEVLEHLPNVSNVTVHVDPENVSGESFHDDEAEELMDAHCEGNSTLPRS